MLVVAPVSSRNMNDAGSMKRCQTRHRFRCAATCCRSCSAALSAFFLCDRPSRLSVDQIVVSEPGSPPPPRDQFVPDLGQRDALVRSRQFTQQILVSGEQRLAIAADLRRRHAARLADPAHQLDRRRCAHIKPLRRCPRRTAFLNRTYQPLTQILGQRCRHHSLAAQSTLSNQNR